MEHFIKTPCHCIQDGFQVCGFSVSGWRSTGVVCQRFPYLKHRIFSVFLLTTNLFKKNKSLCYTFYTTECAAVNNWKYRSYSCYVMHFFNTVQIKQTLIYSQTYVDNTKDIKNETFGLLLSEVTVTSKLPCWTWTKIYDWMVMVCLTVATVVCVPWQDKHILTVAM
jgi:hypothetical protein